MMPRQKEKMMDWTAGFMPKRCEICGRTVLPGSMESLYKLSDQLYGPLFRGLGEMYGGLMGMSAPARKAHSHSHEGGCRECGHHDCHCQCCIVDADLVVYTRAGEQRIAPLVIENSTRREREIRLELGNWTAHGGRKLELDIQSFITPPQFTLAGCEEKQVVLALRIGWGGDMNEDEIRFNEESIRERDFRLPDIEDCTVVYSDLRVEGCDIRPIRIAVAVMPRNCGAFEVECQCGCC
jgi:hypothetical protein